MPGRWSLLAATLLAVLIALAATGTNPRAAADGAEEPASIDTFFQSPEGIRIVREAEEREEARRRRRATPEARDERQRSRSAFRGKTAAQVLQIARDKGGEIVDTEVVGAFPRRAGRRVLDYLDDRVAVVEEPDGIRGIVTSQLPLRTKHGGRGRVPVDLDLIESATDFSPKAPLVPFTFPRQLSRGLTFTRDDVKVRFLVPGGDVAGQGIGGRVLYANVATDSDLLLSPTSTGLESFMQLRSPASPRSHTMQFTLPRGYSLAAASAGDTGETAGIALKKGDKVMAELQPPTSVDAQGQDLPTRYQLIAPDKVRVEVDYNPDEVAFPVYVDPVFDGFGSEAAEYDAPNNFAGWIRSSVPAGFSDQSASYNRKVRATKSGSNPVAGSYLTFEFRAHANAYIYQAEFWNLAHTANNSDSVVGLFTLGSPVTIEPGGIYWSGELESQAYREDGALSGAMRLACARDGCLGSGDASPSYPSPSLPGGANRAVWGLKVDGPPNAPTNFAEATLGGAMISQFEQDKPVWETAPDHGGSSVAGWHERGETFNTQLYPYDKGFGVEKVWISVAGTDPAWEVPEPPGCDGSRTAPCNQRPGSTPAGDPDLPRLTWTTNSMSEGTNYVVPQAKDIVGNQTHEVIDNGRWEVKVDKTKPADPSFSGTLTSNNGWVRDDARTLTVNNATDSRSGVKRVEYTITRDSDGAQVAADGQDNSGCSASGCPTTFSPPPTFNLNLSGLNGAHTLHVKVKDQLWTSTGTYRADHTREKDYKFEIDRAAPTITALGTTPNRWLKDGEQATSTVNATDGGSGIQSFTGLGFPAGSPLADVNRPCGGLTSGSTPPRCASPASEPFTYSINNTRFPDEGRRNVVGKVKDAAGNESSPTNGEVRVDRTPPTIEASGTLYDARDSILFQPSYQLNATGKDGLPPPAPGTEHRSGTKRVRILVKEFLQLESQFVQKEAIDIDCPPDPGSCERSKSWTLNTSEYANKHLTIRIEATDQLGHQSTKDFSVWVLTDLGGVLPLGENRLGLEDFWNYDSVETGAGTVAHTNLATGNLVWHSTPIINPGRGLSSVVNLTYNSQESAKDSLLPENIAGDLLGQYSTAGRGFSLGISGLTRLNEPLDFSGMGPRQEIAFTDPDGTRHLFESEDGCETFKPPKGVQLHLRRFSGPTPLVPSCLAEIGALTDPNKAWAITRPDGVTFFFDRAGYQTSIEDRNGNQIQFKYEYRGIAGGVCTALDPNGDPPNSPTFGDAVCPRRVVEVTDPAGVGETDPVKRAARTLKIDYYANVLENGKSASGPVKSIIDHDDRVTEFNYDEPGDTGYLTSILVGKRDSSDPERQSAGRRFEFTYDALPAAEALLKRRALLSVEDPRGATTSFAHTSSGTDPLGDNLVSRKRVTTLTKRSGSHRSYAYDEIQTGVIAGETTVTDGRGENWVHRMDGEARPTEAVDPKGAITRLAWDAVTDQPADNNLSRITRAADTAQASTTTMTHNHNGQTMTSTDGRDKTTELTYANSGGIASLQSQRQAAGASIDAPYSTQTTGFVSDLSSIVRPEAVVTPDAGDHTTTFTRDGRGNIESRTDGEGNTAETEYVPSGFGLIAFEEDEEDNKTEYRDYDANGLPKTVEDPESGIWQYRYDHVGNVTAATDPRGETGAGPDDRQAPYTTALDYNAFDQLTREVRPKLSEPDSGPAQRITRRWEFDANGNNTLQVDGEGQETEAEHTDMDDPERVINPKGETTYQTYDEEENVLRRVAPKGMADGPADLDYATEFRYDGVGQQVAAIRHSQSDEATSLATSFAYDLRGNVTGIVDPRTNQARGGEPEANAATETNLRFKYDYDLADNPTAQIENPGTTRDNLRTEYSYDDNDNLATETDPRGFESGNQAADFRTTYFYDGRDLLTDVEDPTGAKAHFGFRRDGKLEFQVAPKGTPGAVEESDYTHYRTDFEYDGNGHLTSRSLPRAPGQYGAAAAVTYFRNAVGDPETIIDARGNVFDNEFYDTGDLRTTERPSWWIYGREAEASPSGPDAAIEAMGLSVDAPATPTALPEQAGGPEIRERTDEERRELLNQRIELPESEGFGDFGKVDPQQAPSMLPRRGDTSFAYDDEMRLTDVTDVASKTATIDHDLVGRVTGVHQPLEIPGAGNCDSSGARCIDQGFSFDANGNLLDQTDPRGYTTLLTYDEYDRLTESATPGMTASPSEVTGYTYDANDNLRFLNTPRGTGSEPLAWEMTYDDLDRLDWAENPASERTTFDYDAVGNRTSETSPEDRTFSKTYNALNQVTHSTDPAGKTTEFDYDANGNETTITTPSANDGAIVTTRAYDGRDLPWTETVGTGDHARTSVTEHDPNGNLRREVRPAGVDEDATPLPEHADSSDQTGSPTDDALSHSIVREYSADNQQTTVHLPISGSGDERYRQAFGYDARGRLDQADAPRTTAQAISRTAYSHLDSGWISSSTDPTLVPHNGKPQYDQRLAYEYDDAGNQTLWKSQKGSADRRVMTRSYYPNGLLHIRRAEAAGDPDAREYEYEYNGNHSLTKIVDTDPDRPTVDETRTTNISYDDAERQTVVNETWGELEEVGRKAGKDTVYTYDHDGLVAQRLTDGKAAGASEDPADYAGGRKTGFRYDEVGREDRTYVCTGAQTTCTATNHDRETQSTYYDNNALETRTKPNGVVEEYEYFNDGRLSRMERNKGSNELKNEPYSYDRNGNREEDERGNYEYNARDQLTKWTRDAGEEAPSGSTVDYTVNGTGAVTRKVDSADGRETDFDYHPGGDRLDEVTETTGGVTVSSDYEYDDFGQVTTIDVSGTTEDTTYTHDEFERMTRARGPQQDDDTVYTYDGLDRRDQKQDGTRTLDLSYVGLSEKLSREEDAERAKTYDYDSQMRRLGQSTRPIGGSTWTFRSYAMDALGSVEGLEDADGEFGVGGADRYRYDPYGELQDEETTLGEDAKENPFRFESFYYDAALKTYDMQARAYRPDVGRFLTQDRFEAAGGDLALQADALTQNRYAFAGGNPVNRIEFDGHTNEGSSTHSGHNGNNRAPRCKSGCQRRIKNYRRPAPVGAGVGLGASSGGGGTGAGASAGATANTRPRPESPAQLNPASGGSPSGGPTAFEPSSKKKGRGLWDVVHTGLDAVGLLPGVGEPADLFNCALYAGRGKGVDAGLSCGSAIPIAGYGATAAKAARRAKEAADAAKAGRQSVSDARLGRALGDDYRGGPNPIGDGSALDAARHTVRTGDLVGGSTHLEKVVEMRDRYGRILRRGGLSSADEAVARGRFGAYRDFSRDHRLDEMMRARGLR